MMSALFAYALSAIYALDHAVGVFCAEPLFLCVAYAVYRERGIAVDEIAALHAHSELRGRI